MHTAYSIKGHRYKLRGCNWCYRNHIRLAACFKLASIFINNCSSSPTVTIGKTANCCAGHEFPSNLKSLTLDRGLSWEPSPDSIRHKQFVNPVCSLPAWSALAAHDSFIEETGDVSCNCNHIGIHIKDSRARGAKSHHTVLFGQCRNPFLHQTGLGQALPMLTPPAIAPLNFRTTIFHSAGIFVHKLIEG